MKKIICAALAALICFTLASPALALETLGGEAIDIKAPSAVLMEKESGQVIYEKDAHTRRAPASVTKVMTLLLIVEALERGDIKLTDTVVASHRAASFGGSCVFLEEGEKMSVDEMLKCITVVSANDCAVAMSEFLCGSEQGFVKRMNKRAAELGLKDTHFGNCTGLFEDKNHYTSAYDLAVMSRELIKHELIKKYSTIWMDSIRGGKFGLTNTNKLVKQYDGCTGLKTGFTDEAMYCLSATAERDGVEYIAVIMHAESIDSRNQDAKALLNYGFANFKLISLRHNELLPPVAVKLGKSAYIQPEYTGESSALIEKAGAGEVSYKLHLPESVTAPVKKGQKLGELELMLGGKKFKSVPLVAAQSVARQELFEIFTKLSQSYVGLG